MNSFNWTRPMRNPERVLAEIRDEITPETPDTLLMMWGNIVCLNLQDEAPGWSESGKMSLQARDWSYTAPSQP